MNRANVSLQQDNATNILRLRKGVLQRKCACRNKTIARGECAGCAKKKNNLQRKLSIGASNDPLEREADRVADQVMAMSGNSSIGRTTPRIQRFTGQSVGQTDIAPASVDRVLASSGQPMEPALRQDMEQRFGHDFSQVRVHTGAPAERSARDMNANAYTAGHNIVFGEGQFSSGSNEGQRLIAHELTHVVQQEGAVGKQIRKEETNSPVISPKLTFSSQYQFVQLQRGVASIRETTINVRWIDDDVRFYHRVINAISRSRRFRGVRKASLWQPFHDPIFRLFHRLARRRPLLSTGSLIRLQSSAWFDPIVFHGQVSSASIQIEHTQRQSEENTVPERVSVARQEAEPSADTSSVRVDGSAASINWIDASSPAGSSVSDSPPPSNITETFVTGSSGFRYSNYLHAWLSITNESRHITGSGFATNSGIYKSPSMFGIPSRSFVVRRRINPISRAGVEGIEFEQTVGARTISAGVAGGVVGGTIGVGGGALLGAKIGALGGVPGAILGGLIGGGIGYFSGTAVANRVVNFPPIWTKMKLKLFANGDKECEVVEHSLFPSQSYYCDMTRISSYNALSRQQTSWENRGWDNGNPWGISRPLFTP